MGTHNIHSERYTVNTNLGMVHYTPFLANYVLYVITQEIKYVLQVNHMYSVLHSCTVLLYALCFGTIVYLPLWYSLCCIRVSSIVLSVDTQGTRKIYYYNIGNGVRDCYIIVVCKKLYTNCPERCSMSTILLCAYYVVFTWGRNLSCTTRYVVTPTIQKT